MFYFDSFLPTGNEHYVTKFTWYADVRSEVLCNVFHSVFSNVLVCFFKIVVVPNLTNVKIQQ